MELDKLKSENIVEVLKSVDTNLSAVGDARGIMTVFVKCTLDIGDKLDGASSEIRSFNESTTSLNKRLLWLNCVLAIATIVGAFATLKLSGIL